MSKNFLVNILLFPILGCMGGSSKPTAPLPPPPPVAQAPLAVGGDNISNEANDIAGKKRGKNKLVVDLGIPTDGSKQTGLGV